VCGEETFEKDGLGTQVCLFSSLRSRSTGKATAARCRDKSREAPYEKPTTAEKPVAVVDKKPCVLLDRMEVVLFGVEKTDSTFVLTAKKEGESSSRETSNPQPGTSGLGTPDPPARDGVAQDVGAMGDVSPVPTVIMDSLSSQESPAEGSDDSPSGSEVDVGVQEILDDIIEEEEKRGRGRPETTGEYRRKKRRDAQRALRFKEMKRTRRAAEAVRSSPPKGKKKWAMVHEKEEELEYELSGAPTQDIASRMVEQSVKIFKIVDCSNSMKGSLVKELQGAVALVRAATSVLATRAREVRGEGEADRLLKVIEELRAESAQLRGEMEYIKTRLPLRSSPAPLRRRLGRNAPPSQKRGRSSSRRARRGREKTRPPPLESHGLSPSTIEGGEEEKGKRKGSPSKRKAAR